jgi:hypothetical protein
VNRSGYFGRIIDSESRCATGLGNSCKINRLQVALELWIPQHHDLLSFDQAQRIVVEDEDF